MESAGMNSFRDDIMAERRDSMRVAKAFAQAAADGDAERFFGLARLLSEKIDGWCFAMKNIAKLERVSDEIKAAFLPAWIESKGLSRKVGDRKTLALALRVLFPCDYQGPMLRLYRGTRRSEYARRLYGFSWSTRRDIAIAFAARHTEAYESLQASGPPYAGSPGVLLQADVPAEAILLVRQDEDYYDEGEVVIDPYALKSVTIAT